jgi:outer membrane receptor protein involved in Fe transport
LNHEFNFGGNLIYYPLDRGQVEPLGESFRKPVNLGKERGLQSGLYLSDKITITDWLTLYAGFRFNTFTNLGPADVNHYFEGTEKKEENIAEVMTYDDWEPVVTYTGPAVRSGLNLKLAANTSMKLSFSQMNQYLFMASNTISVAPDDQWKLADYHLKPQSSYQYSAGVYQYFPETDVNASLEFYKKENRNILEYKDGADFVNIPEAEISILQGDQSTHGVEFMLEKKSGRFDGWLSYTWSRSMITVDGDKPWEKINGGKPYPSNYDKPHVLNLVGTYRINRIFVFSSSIVYSTGRPITLPESLYYIDDQPFISFSGRNAERVPDYFRSDLSLTIEGNLRRDKLFHSTWIFNIYNLTGRNNVQSIFFRSEEGKIQGYELSIIGVPVFTITWSVKLGNYASK